MDDIREYNLIEKCLGCRYKSYPCFGFYINKYGSIYEKSKGVECMKDKKMEITKTFFVTGKCDNCDFFKTHQCIGIFVNREGDIFDGPIKIKCFLDDTSLYKECENCFQLHQMDCAGIHKPKELDCYLHRKQSTLIKFKYSEYMEKCYKLSTNSTCLSRKVGCVIVKNNEIIAEAYNYTINCKDICRRKKENIPSGTRADICNSVHAEFQALDKAGDNARDADLFVNCSPCFLCAKMIIHKGIKRVIYDELYNDIEAINLLKDTGIELIQIKDLIKLEQEKIEEMKRMIDFLPDSEPNWCEKQRIDTLEQLAQLNKEKGATEERERIIKLIEEKREISFQLKELEKCKIYSNIIKFLNGDMKENNIVNKINFDEMTENLYKIKETLSDLCHQMWSGWMEYLFTKCITNENGSLTIPQEFVERWARQIDTCYENLSEEEKNSDRIEAERIITILRNIN